MLASATDDQAAPGYGRERLSRLASLQPGRGAVGSPRHLPHTARAVAGPIPLTRRNSRSSAPTAARTEPNVSSRVRARMSPTPGIAPSMSAATRPLGGGRSTSPRFRRRSRLRLSRVARWARTSAVSNTSSVRSTGTRYAVMSVRSAPRRLFGATSTTPPYTPQPLQRRRQCSVRAAPIGPRLRTPRTPRRTRRGRCHLHPP